MTYSLTTLLAKFQLSDDTGDIQRRENRTEPTQTTLLITCVCLRARARTCIHMKRCSINMTRINS